MRRALALLCCALALTAAGPVRATDADVQAYMDYARAASAAQICALDNYAKAINTNLGPIDPMSAVCGDQIASRFEGLTDAFSGSDGGAFDRLASNTGTFMDTNLSGQFAGVDLSGFMGSGCELLSETSGLRKCLGVQDFPEFSGALNFSSPNFGFSGACSPCTAPGAAPDPLANEDLTTPVDVGFTAPCTTQTTPLNTVLCKQEGCYEGADGKCTREGEPAPFRAGWVPPPEEG